MRNGFNDHLENDDGEAFGYIELEIERDPYQRDTRDMSYEFATQQGTFQVIAIAAAVVIGVLVLVLLFLLMRPAPAPQPSAQQIEEVRQLREQLVEVQATQQQYVRPPTSNVAYSEVTESTTVCEPAPERTRYDQEIGRYTEWHDGCRWRFGEILETPEQIDQSASVCKAWYER